MSMRPHRICKNTNVTIDAIDKQPHVQRDNRSMTPCVDSAKYACAKGEKVVEMPNITSSKSPKTTRRRGEAMSRLSDQKFSNFF